MHIEQLIPVGKDVLLAVFSIVGAYVALRGLNTWDRQLKGSAEYHLARRILKVSYRLRDAIKRVRHPAIWNAEMLAPTKEESENVTDEEVRYFGTRRAYEARWQRVADIRTDLQTELLEAEVLWGTELGQHFEALFKLEHELLVAIRGYLDRSNPRESEVMKAAIYKRQQNARDIMYDSLEDQGDEFTRDVARVIAPIEEYLKPHLRR